MKSKVIFKFDKEKDLHNIWETCNKGKGYGYDFTKHMPKEIVNICKGKKFSECKPKLKKIFDSIYKNPVVKDIEDYLNNSWKNIEKEYFNKLEKLTKRKFPLKIVYAYLTSASRCPYNYDKRNPSFYAQIFNSIPNNLMIAGHELMHIHLHNTDWWERVKRQIGQEKTHDLKEALTELLNLEFRTLWIVDDKGYPNHIQLREFIKKEWKKEKNFDKLTDNCIKWIKKNGVK
jgi:hypothetical protein